MQAFTALQFILEEKYVAKYRVPVLLAVGLEGAWGLLLCACVLPVLATLHGQDGLPLDDAIKVCRQGQPVCKYVVMGFRQGKGRWPLVLWSPM